MDNVFNLISWRLIAILGKNKIVNRSYIYLFIVPFVANLLKRIKSPLSLEIGGACINLNIDLPFSWKLFFWAAMCFTVGSILYNIFVPEILKENDSYGDFIIKKRNFAHLLSYRNNMGIDRKFIETLGGDELKLSNHTGLTPLLYKIDENSKIIFKKRVKKRVKLYNITQINLKDYNRGFSERSNTETGVQIPRQKTNFIEWTFWSLFEFANTSYPIQRNFTFCVYLTGLALVARVIFECALVVFLF